MTPHLGDVVADATHRCAFHNTCSSFLQLLLGHSADKLVRTAAPPNSTGSFDPFSRAHFTSAHAVLRCNINATGTGNVPRATKTLRNSFVAHKVTLHNSRTQIHEINYSDVICLVVKCISVRLRRCVPPFLYKNGGTHAGTQRLYRSLCRPPHWML